MGGSMNYNQSEQWVLFKALDNILKFHEKDRFSNLIQITSQNPELMFNRVFACAPEVAKFYTELTPVQKAFLQPQVRLFRMKADGTEREIAFASNFNSDEFNEIAQGAADYNKEPGRLDGSALKKITISEKPERPTDVNLSCKIDLFFDNITSVFNTNVLELITTPIRRDNFDSRDYRIKMLLGWNVPSDSSGLQFSSVQKDIINSSNVVYLLELVQHNINFRENGSLDLSIEYAGAIESALKNNNKYDIFKIDINKDSFRGVYGAAKESDAFFSFDRGVERINEAGEYYIELFKSFVNPNQPPTNEQKTQQDVTTAHVRIEYLARNARKQQLNDKLQVIATKQAADNIKSIKSEKNKELEEIQKEMDEINARLSNIDVLILREKYAQILDWTMRSNRIFYIPIRPEIFALLGAVDDPKAISVNLGGNTSIIFDALAKVQPIQLKYTVDGKPNPALDQLISHSAGLKEAKIETQKSSNEENLKDIEDTTNETSEDIYEKLNKINRLIVDPNIDPVRVLAGNANPDVPFQNFDIFYILLGDLINIVTYLSGNAQANDPSNPNIVLGPFRFGGKIINLAQIPIALNQFSSFFVNKVIKTVRKSYFLWDFIQDVITDLVIPQLTGENLSLPSMPNLSVTNTTVISTQPLIAGEVYSDTKLANSLSRGYAPGQQIYSYMVIYCRSFDLPPRNGNLIKDAEDGIFHFGIGRNVGVVKSINFTKIDQPKVRDARLTGDELNRAGKVLREHYNCRLSLIGNPMFIPGAHFYFDGSYLGQRGRQAAEAIGLGGYYMINGIDSTFTPGKYEMSVDGFWQTMADYPRTEETSYFVELMNEYKKKPGQK